MERKKLVAGPACDWERKLNVLEQIAELDGQQKSLARLPENNFQSSQQFFMPPSREKVGP